MIRVSGLAQLLRNGVATRTPDGLNAREQLDRIERAHAAHARRAGALRRASCCPRVRDECLRIVTWSELDARRRAAAVGAVPREDLPGADAARRRSGAPVSLPLQPQPQPRRRAARSRGRRAALRARQGADAACCRASWRCPAAGRCCRSSSWWRRTSTCSSPAWRSSATTRFACSATPTSSSRRTSRGSASRSSSTRCASGASARWCRWSSRRDMPTHLRRLLSSELDVALEEVIEMPGLLGLAELDDLPRSRAPPRPALRALDAAARRGACTAATASRPIRSPSCAAATCWCTCRTTRSPTRSRRSSAPPSTIRRCWPSSRRSIAPPRARRSWPAWCAPPRPASRWWSSSSSRRASTSSATSQWARRLEDAGAHVVYGVVGLKTHAKTVLVVRQEGDAIRRYVHIGTGNYNGKTARLYEDLGLLSCRPELGEDVSELFNLMTGYSRQRDFHLLVRRALRPARRARRAHRARDRARARRHGRAHRAEDEQPRRPAR